jgi:hypothetical protein
VPPKPTSEFHLRHRATQKGLAPLLTMRNVGCASVPE